MCSIVGVSFGSRDGHPERWSPTELAQLMLRTVAPTGPDAFGLMWCTAAGEVQSAKWAGPASNPRLLAQADVPDDAVWFVGHVRNSRPSAGGRGPATEPTNNHPVRHGDVIGVHAGSISNYRRILATTGRMDERTETDTEAAFAAVAGLGPVAGLAALNGHLAVGFADVRDPATVRLARSWGPRLYLTRTDGGALAFASRRSPLTVVGTAENIIQVAGRYQMLTVQRGRVTGQRQYRPVRWMGRDGANRARRMTTVLWHWYVSPGWRRRQRNRQELVPPDPAALLADLTTAPGDPSEPVPR